MERKTTLFLLLLVSSHPCALPVYAAEGNPQKTFRYNADNKRDPFIPLIIDNRLVGANFSASGQGKPVLYGILWDPAGKSIALVDDTEAKVGDSVRGYRVIAIRKDAVVLEADGQTVELDIAFGSQPSGATTQKEHPSNE